MQKELLATIHALTPRKVVVIGDMMLDQYTWGDVGRISPEAPIPVLRVREEEFRLGGAANVAANIRALDCRVYPVGVVGSDTFGRRLFGIMKDMSLSTEGVVDSESFQTTVKKRVLTKQQQLIRIDYENPESTPGSFERELAERIDRLLPGADAAVISDYGKGVFSRELLQSTIQKAATLKIPLICDPAKGVDYRWYRGVTTIKPNRHETEQATGIKLKDRRSILQAAEILREQCDARFISLSLDRDGILLYRNANDYTFVETDAQEVFDVTGAGDTVIATIAVLLANGVDPESAVRIANVAAKLELSHMGVAAIPWSRIAEHLTTDGLSRKITTPRRLAEETASDRETPLVFTNGYFDRLSAGHLRFLIEASKIPGKLVVAINSDRSILKQKGRCPLLNEKDRARLLASLESVHRVVVFDTPDASALIRALSPRIVIKGEQFRNVAIPERKAIEAVGATVEYLRHFAV